VEANSTGGQGLQRAVAPSDDVDDDNDDIKQLVVTYFSTALKVICLHLFVTCH
jgi:hypothetical protein